MLLFYLDNKRPFYRVFKDGHIEKYGKNFYSNYACNIGYSIYYNGRKCCITSLGSRMLTGKKHTIYKYSYTTGIFGLYDLGMEKMIKSVNIGSTSTVDPGPEIQYPYNELNIIDYFTFPNEILYTLDLDTFEKKELRKRKSVYQIPIGNTYIMTKSHNIIYNHRKSICFNSYGCYYRIFGDKLIIRDSCNDIVRVSVYDENLDCIQKYHIPQINSYSIFIWVDEQEEYSYNENWEPMEIYDIEETLIINLDYSQLKIPKWLII